MPREALRVLVTGAAPGAEGLVEALRERGDEVALLPWERDELAPEMTCADAIVCNDLFGWHPVAGFPSLRAVQLTSAGLDRAPVAELRERGVKLFNAAGVYSVPMAEHALCATLMLLRQMPGFLRSQQARAWEKRRDLRELAGCRVLVVGCGSVGAECARRFAAFGCEVVGVDRTAGERDVFGHVARMEALDAELEQADVVLLALPLTDETRGLIGAGRIDHMKPGALLVNVARGGLVDQAALVDALAAGRIGGAALDVFEDEPLPSDSPLWELENAIVTPHNSFVGDGNAARFRALALRNLDSVRRAA